VENLPLLPPAVLADEEVPALVLAAVVLRKYGPEALEWQPELLRDELEQDYGVKVSGLQSDKLQAVFTLLLTDLYEGQWEVFETVGHLLNGQPDTFEDFSPLDAEGLAAALAHRRLVVGDDPDRTPFSPEVRAYAGLVFQGYGLSRPPAIFPEAILPGGLPEADPAALREKDEALGEMFDARTRHVREWLDRLAPA
jgi:hypothetical protein